MSNTNPAEFVRQVRQEMEKVTWPTRRETLISTAMVLVLATIAATFFVFVDMLIGSLVRWVLGI